MKGLVFAVVCVAMFSVTTGCSYRTTPIYLQSTSTGFIYGPLSPKEGEQIEFGFDSLVLTRVSPQAANVISKLKTTTVQLTAMNLTIEDFVDRLNQAQKESSPNSYVHIEVDKPDLLVLETTKPYIPKYGIHTSHERSLYEILMLFSKTRQFTIEGDKVILKCIDKKGQ